MCAETAGGRRQWIAAGHGVFLAEREGPELPERRRDRIPQPRYRKVLADVRVLWGSLLMRPDGDRVRIRARPILIFWQDY